MVFKLIKEEIDAILDRDPAARTRLEVVLCYPGFHAVVVYRLAHWLWGKGFKLGARFLSHLAKVFTGIEIHPGATIGERLFIDHATGVVIGETAEVGDDVTLYQGVTLGGTSLNPGKRHPTLMNGVIVGSGAQVLGPLTIGEGARIGANAVVLTDVPAHTTMVGVPARAAKTKATEDFSAYGVPKDLSDPMTRALGHLHTHIKDLQHRIDTLESKLAEAEARAGDGAGPHLVTDVETQAQTGPSAAPESGGKVASGSG